MRIDWIKQSGSGVLLVFFNGWGMDVRAIPHLSTKFIFNFIYKHPGKEFFPALFRHATLCQLITLTKEKGLYVNDLVEEMCLTTATRYDLPLSHCLVGDIEELPLPGEFDLLVSASTFQWFASPYETFHKLASHLRKDTNDGQ